MKHILLLTGGNSTEHEVSIVSGNYIKETLSKIDGINVYDVLIRKDGQWVLGEEDCKFLLDGTIQIAQNMEIKIDYCVPCIHGYPGETGDIQSLLEMAKVPYLGPGPEAHMLCFNKITTKLWLDALKIPNTPYLIISSKNYDKSLVKSFFHQHNRDLFVKASNQGSSVGCYRVTEEKDLCHKIDEAFKYSPFVLIEKKVSGRELEISAYQYEGKVYVSDPGEIILPGNTFYTYEEKYDNKSQTKTEVKAKGLSKEIIKKMRDISEKAFINLNLKDLSRIDFFLEGDQIYLNEINTFPGMTPISMFPKMMEANGTAFIDFLRDKVANL